MTRHHGSQCSLAYQSRLLKVTANPPRRSCQFILAHIFDSAIFSSSNDPNSNKLEPVLQCVQVKPIAGQPGAPERFRVVFSDIINFVQSMLATRTSLDGGSFSHGRIETKADMQ